MPYVRKALNILVTRQRNKDHVSGGSRGKEATKHDWFTALRVWDETIYCVLSHQLVLWPILGNYHSMLGTLTPHAPSFHQNPSCCSKDWLCAFRSHWYSWQVIANLSCCHYLKVSGKYDYTYAWADIRCASSICAAELARGTANVNAAKENSITSADLRNMVSRWEKICKK